MLQFCVDKQGTIRTSQWSNRLLTVDTVNQSVFLSKKNEPQELHHHKMRVTSVTLWPHVNALHLNCDVYDREAQLTVRMDGTEEVATAKDRTNLAAMTKFPALQPRAAPSQPGEEPQAFWIIKCTSLGSLEALVSAFVRTNAIASRVSTVNGALSALQSTSPSPPSTGNISSLPTAVVIKGSPQKIAKLSAKIGHSIEEEEMTEFA